MYSKQIILVYLWLHYALTSNESLGCSSDWCLNKSRSRGWGNPKLFPLNCCNKTGTHGYRQFPHQNIWYRSSRKEHGNWNWRFQWSSRGKPFNYNQLYKQIHGKEVPRDSWVFWYPNIYAFILKMTIPLCFPWSHFWPTFYCTNFNSIFLEPLVTWNCCAGVMFPADPPCIQATMCHCQSWIPRENSSVYDKQVRVYYWHILTNNV